MPLCPDLAACPALFGLLACLAAASAAQAGHTDECGTVYDTRPDRALARVAARSTFVKSASEAAGCPSDRPACFGKAFVVPGDLVVTGATHGPFTCADYVGHTGRHRVGWLPTGDLIPAPPARVEASDWVGRWEAGEAQVTVRTGKAGRLHIDGYATFGADDPERAKMGAINVGSFQVDDAPQGDRMAFAIGSGDEAVPIAQAREGDCAVRMRRLGPYLVVRDNNRCGGLNVSFNGVYRRTR